VAFQTAFSRFFRLQIGGIVDELGLGGSRMLRKVACVARAARHTVRAELYRLSVGSWTKGFHQLTVAPRACGDFSAPLRFSLGFGAEGKCHQQDWKKQRDPQGLASHTSSISTPRAITIRVSN
jgi:hypothetical protein